MFCAICGAENEKSACFCQRCGTALVRRGDPQRRAAWIWIAAAGGALIALAAAVAILLRVLQPIPPVIPVPATPPASTALTASFLTPTVAEPTTPAKISPTPILALGTSNLYIEYILDASNSMNDALPDGTVKRTEAEKLLADHLRAFRPETNIGLRAFGHRVGSSKEESCQDIEQVAPVEKGQVERIVSWLRDVQPQGWTPLAEAIRQAMGDFVFDPARINAVVLLSDGQETCGGDPCKLVEDLKAQGVNFTIHVIGLNVDEPARQQLRCIAREAGGTYHDARSEEDLGQALKDVQKEVSTNEVVKPNGVNTSVPTETPVLMEATNVCEGLIAYVGLDGNIWTVFPDGTGLRQLTDEHTENNYLQPTAPVWSWEGMRIAYVSEVTGNLDICVMDSDGSHKIKLTDSPADEWGPVWSADSTKIAFVSNRVGDGLNANICVMPSTGGEALRLTNYEYDQGLVSMGWLSWNSLADRLVYNLELGVAYCYPAEMISNDGSRVATIPDCSGFGMQPPSWSPDGTRLAIALGPSMGLWTEVYLVGVDGSVQAQLTNGDHTLSSGEHNWNPKWSPDGRLIAFVSDRHHFKGAGALRDGNDIMVMDADGSNQRRLTASPGWDTHPVWSPDSSSIAFVRKVQTNQVDGEIWVMNADGSAQRKLIDGLAPAWQPCAP